MSLPYLRFTRDPRGYEKTYLIHTTRRHGKPMSRVLYCFRTPPNVKVGRPALDEEAIRLLESLHPDVDFDWPQILKAQPPPPPPPQERPRRPKRGVSPPAAGRAERPAKERKDRRPAPSPGVPAVGLPAPFEPEPATTALAIPEPGEEIEARSAPSQALHPVATLLGAEGLARLRARHAELLVRIAERPIDESAREALRLEAEALDPDRWVTDAEARQGIEAFDGRSAALAARLGPRRRRRRGGRGRRRKGSTPGGAPVPAASAEAPGPPDEPSDDGLDGDAEDGDASDA